MHPQCEIPWLETGFLGENPINYFFTYFDIFERKYILFGHFWQKITFLMILRKGLAIFSPKLSGRKKGRAATAAAAETWAKFVRVAVAVTPKYFTETINCNRGTFFSSGPCCSCTLYKMSCKPYKILVEKSLLLPFPSPILHFLSPKK